MSGVAAGRLRHWVELQRDELAQDPDTGEMISNWVRVDEMWAEIVPSSAREFIAASAQQSEVRGRMTIRFRDDIDASMRIVYRGKWYSILGVMEDDDSMLEHMTIMTAEGVRLER